MKVGDFVLAKYPLIDGTGLGVILGVRKAFKFGYDYRVYWAAEKRAGWVRGYNLEQVEVIKNNPRTKNVLDFFIQSVILSTSLKQSMENK